MNMDVKIGALLNSLFASSTLVTLMETANQVLDLVAGILAVLVGVLTALWWMKKLKKGEEDGSSNESV